VSDAELPQMVLCSPPHLPLPHRDYEHAAKARTNVSGVPAHLPRVITWLLARYTSCDYIDIYLVALSLFS